MHICMDLCLHKSMQFDAHCHRAEPPSFLFFLHSVRPLPPLQRLHTVLWFLKRAIHHAVGTLLLALHLPFCSSFLPVSYVSSCLVSSLLISPGSHFLSSPVSISRSSQPASSYIRATKYSLGPLALGHLLFLRVNHVHTHSPTVFSPLVSQPLWRWECDGQSLTELSHAWADSTLRSIWDECLVQCVCEENPQAKVLHPKAF